MTTPRGGQIERLGHVPALDGVRALAILLVFAVHLTYIAMPELQGRFVPGGFIGVDIFFVLSGFLITTLLVEDYHRGRHSLLAFYERRALRLLPAVLFLLLCHIGYASVVDLDGEVEFWSILAASTYWLNWLYSIRHTSAEGLGHLWSLSVEEQFYLVWPLVLIPWLVRRPRIGLLLGAALAAAVWRYFLFRSGLEWDRIYVRTEVRLDALLIGAALAFLRLSGWNPAGAVRRGLAWCGAAGLFLVAIRVHRESAFLFAGGFTLVAASSAALIFGCLDPSWAGSRILSSRPIAYLGHLSYSLYLWHVPVFFAWNRIGGEWHPAPRGALAAATALLLAATSLHVIERPFLQLKRARSMRIRERVS